MLVSVFFYSFIAITCALSINIQPKNDSIEPPLVSHSNRNNLKSHIIAKTKITADVSTSTGKEDATKTTSHASVKSNHNQYSISVTTSVSSGHDQNDPATATVTKAASNKEDTITTTNRSSTSNLDKSATTTTSSHTTTPSTKEKSRSPSSASLESLKTAHPTESIKKNTTISPTKVTHTSSNDQDQTSRNSSRHDTNTSRTAMTSLPTLIKSKNTPTIHTSSKNFTSSNDSKTSTASEIPSSGLFPNLNTVINNILPTKTLSSSRPTTTENETAVSTKTTTSSLMATETHSSVDITHSTGNSRSFTFINNTSTMTTSTPTPTPTGIVLQSKKQMANSTSVLTEMNSKSSAKAAGTESSNLTISSSAFKNVTSTEHTITATVTSESASSIETLFAGHGIKSLPTSIVSTITKSRENATISTEISSALSTGSTMAASSKNTSKPLTTIGNPSSITIESPTTSTTSTTPSTTTTTTTTTTITDEPTPITETTDTDITKSTYKYETLAWLSGSFVYHTSTDTITATTTTTTTTSAAATITATDTTATDTTTTAAAAAAATTATTAAAADTTTPVDGTTAAITTSENTASATTTATPSEGQIPTGNNTASKAEDNADTTSSSTITANTSSTTSSSTTTSDTTSTETRSATKAHAASPSNSGKDLPQYITPNLNAIIPDTSQITNIKFNSISYATLVSDALMTAQLVQELPAMLGKAMDTSADNVIIVSIQETAMAQSNKRYDASSDRGIMVSIAIPKAEVTELQALVTNTSSPLYSSQNGQLPTFIDRSFPITATPAQVGDANGANGVADPNGNDNHSKNTNGGGLPQGGIIGICVGVGVCVYAAATVAGVRFYRKRKQTRNEQISEQHRAFAKSISSPIMQGNSLGFIPAPYQQSIAPSNLTH